MHSNLQLLDKREQKKIFLHQISTYIKFPWKIQLKFNVISQHGAWGFTSPGTWFCVTALVVPNILQKQGAISFKGQVHEECQMWETGGDI